MLALTGCSDEANEPPPATTGSEGEGGAGGQAPTELEPGLLDYPCAPGELELDDGCQLAGIPASACPTGFASDDLGGCLPILPADPCGPGTMATPGETSCREVAPCGSDRWAGIPVEANTIYVDKSFVGTSDGSAAAPFKGLPAAISAAAPDAIVALAPGSYNYLTLETKPVRLWGKCPDEVSFTQGIYVKGQASGTEIHRVGVTSGGNIGILVENTDVLVEETWVHDVPRIGVYVYTLDANATASLTVRGSLIEHVIRHGAYDQGCELKVESSVIRDVAADGNERGDGIQHYFEEGLSAAPGTVEVTSSLLERTVRSGIRMWTGTLTVLDTAIREVVPLAGEDEGSGISVRSADGRRATATVDGVTVQGTVFGGVLAVDAELTARRVTIRDVVASPIAIAGIGLGALATGDEPPPEIALRGASVADVEQAAVIVSGAEALLEGLRVTRITGTDTDTGFGLGLGVEPDIRGTPSVATLRGIAVESVQTLGIYVASSQAIMSEIAVRDVDPQRFTNAFGRGIGLEYSPQMSDRGSNGTLENCAIEDVHDSGVAVLGSSAAITSCLIDGVAQPPETTTGGEPSSFGILVQDALVAPLSGSATIDHVQVERAVGVGIAVGGAEATVAASIVRNVGAPEGPLGDGITAFGLLYHETGGTTRVAPSTVAVTGSRVAGSYRAGLAAFSSSLELTGNEILCNAISLNGESFEGVTFEVADGGGNRCGCDGTWQDCTVLSSNLSPPSPADPGK
jgi:hypothetical protein